MKGIFGSIAESKRFRMRAKDTYLYEANGVKVQVTTIVAVAPKGNECAGDCAENTGYAAELNIQFRKLQRKYNFKTGACDL